MISDLWNELVREFPSMVHHEPMMLAVGVLGIVAIGGFVIQTICIFTIAWLRDLLS